ncbi:MAG: GerW family sporulation protein [Bacillota bacterium]
MAEHPIQGLMKTAMESIRDMVDVNTIVGDPVEAQDGSVIMPVSRVSFGFAAGGAEYGSGGRRSPEKAGESGGAYQLPFGGGSGAGVTIRPVGFLVVGQGQVRMLPVDGKAYYDRLIDLMPQVLQELSSIVRGDGGVAYTQPAAPPAGRRVRTRPEA